MEQDTQSDVSSLLDYNSVELDQKNIIQKIRFPDASVLVPIRINYDGDGIGEIQYENGGSYHGHLQGASPSGFGMYTTDELTLVGVFAEQTLDGVGAVRYQNGSVTMGTFQNGQLTGYGSQYEASQQYYYAGQYRVSRPNGLGTLIQGDVGRLTAGEWAHCLQFGTFVEGSLNGRGVSVMAACSEVSNPLRFNRYEGYFTYGVRDGSGALFLANGELLVGNFRRGVKNGLFAHVGAQGALTLRFYDGDVVRRSYYSVSHFVERPHLLRCLQFDALDLEAYDANVAYFKLLEAGDQHKAGNQQNQHFPAMNMLFRLCRRLSAPLQQGVCEDPRVCQPMLSEWITEVVRNQDGGSLEDQSLFRAVDDLKSAVINSYDVFKFLFDFYRARDKFVAARRDHRQFSSILQAEVDEFTRLCEKIDAETLATQQAELLARQQEFEQVQENKDKEKEEEEGESESTDKTAANNTTADSPITSPARPGFTDNNTPMETHSAEGPEVNLEGTDRNPTSPLRHSDSVHMNENEADSRVWQRNGSGYIQKVREFLDRCGGVALGSSESENELLRLFCGVLDSQQQLTRGAAVALVHDIASVLGLQRELRSNEPHLDQLAARCSVPADSALMLRQFGLSDEFCVSERVLGLEHFVCFMLQVYELFGVKTALSFIQNQLTQFARKIMEGLATVLADDQEQLDHFLESLEARQGISTQSTRRLGTAQTSPDTKSVYTHTGPRSQISRVTKNTLGSVKTSMTIPRVLVRDFSYQLSEVERALMRTAGLTEKVAQLYEVRAENQRGLLFHAQVNEQLERLITQEHAGLLTSRLDLDGANITLLQLLQLGLNGLHHLFAFPAFEEDVQFYANVLVPFYLRYTNFDVYAILFESYQAKQKAAPPSPGPTGSEGAQSPAPSPQLPEVPAEVPTDENLTDTRRTGLFKTLKKAGPLDEDVPLQNFYEVATTEIMTTQKLLGLMSCFFLKSPNTYQKEPEKPEFEDPDEQTSQLNSEDMAASIRSENSLYSKNQTLLQEQQQLKDKSLRQDAIQQCMELPKPCVPTVVVQIAGDFLSGLETVIYDQ